MTPRAFYLPPEDWRPPLALTGSEAEHFRVLRLGAGDVVLLLDGQGRKARCRVASVDKKSVVLEPLSERRVPPPAARPIMALALSKAVRRDFFLEKASELGAWQLWLWRARRSQGKLDDGLGRAARGKLVAGLKQSRNPWLPQVKIFDGIGEVIAASAGFPWRIMPWEESDGARMATPEQLGREGDTIYVIGPEGGFAPEEVSALFEAGFDAVSFGKRALRCETAAMLCLGLHWWASQLPGRPDNGSAV